MKNKPWSKPELDLLQKTAESLQDDAAIIYEVSKATKRSASAIANKLWQLRKNSQVPEDSRIPVMLVIVNGVRLELHMLRSTLQETSALRIYDKANNLVGTLQVNV